MEQSKGLMDGYNIVMLKEEIGTNTSMKLKYILKDFERGISFLKFLKF